MTEDESRIWLVNIRWGKIASCPHCHNPKSYIIENSKRFKCANPNCKKKFSLTTKTLMEATLTPLKKWIQAVNFFIKKNGEIKVWDLEKEIDVSYSTSSYILDRLNVSWKYVLKGQPHKEMAIDMFKTLFNLYEKYEESKPLTVLKNIDNIADHNQYKLVVRYTKSWLRYARWINTDHFTIEDIIAETFIYMHENSIKEYNAELVSFLIRKTSQKMYMEWIKSHPNRLRHYNDYHREYQRNSRININNTYINHRLRKRFKDKKSSEIAADKILQKEQKDRIIEFRKKYGILKDFNSHFD